MENNKNQNNGGCPFHNAANTSSGTTNRDWWPNKLRLDILRQHSAKSDPMGEEFDYAEEFNSLDYDALSRINPDLVYCSLTAYCQYGPYHDRACYDIVLSSLLGDLPSTC